jgi:hypothetical protein
MQKHDPCPVPLLGRRRKLMKGDESEDGEEEGEVEMDGISTNNTFEHSIKPQNPVNLATYIMP